MTEPQVYLNGRVIPASQAHLAIFDAGVVFGATVSEMTRTFRHQPFRLDDHLDRLFQSLRYARIDIGMCTKRLAEISRELVAANAALLDEHDDLGLVHFVTPGEHATYRGWATMSVRETPTVCMHTFPLPWELWAEKLRAGQHLVTPSIRHVPTQCIDAKIKHRSRMNYYLADQEAQLVDSGASALLLDLDGNVTETSGANLFLVDDGTLVSPTTRNTLPGVSRATVFELAHQVGMRVAERDIQVHSVINAEEAFTTSTSYCMLPVTKLNGIRIGSGLPGPNFQRLLRAWSARVGVDIEHQITIGQQWRRS